jgi:hypothetical protein
MDGSDLTAGANRYLLIRIVGSRSGGSGLLRLDLILSARLASYGSGRWARGTAAPATGARLPLAGAGQTRPSGLGFGRHQVLEIERDAENPSRGLGRLIRARVGDLHDEGGSGSRRQVGRARTEGDREGKGARRAPYLAGVLRRRLEAEDRGLRCRIAVAQGGLAAELPSGRAAERWR